MQAANITQLDLIKHNNAQHVDDKALKYLNTIPDTRGSSPFFPPRVFVFKRERT